MIMNSVVERMIEDVNPKTLALFIEDALIGLGVLDADVVEQILSDMEEYEGRGAAIQTLQRWNTAIRVVNNYYEQQKYRLITEQDYPELFAQILKD